MTFFPPLQPTYTLTHPRLALQQCVFKVDYVVEQIGNREFGSVFLDQQENVALAVVSGGWAKVGAGS